MNHNKLNQLFNNLISNLYICCIMSEIIWKCFRCNLSFKDESVGEMHKEIAGHSVTKVKTMVA